MKTMHPHELPTDENLQKAVLGSLRKSLPEDRTDRILHRIEAVEMQRTARAERFSWLYAAAGAILIFVALDLLGRRLLPEHPSIWNTFLEKLAGTERWFERPDLLFAVVLTGTSTLLLLLFDRLLRRIWGTGEDPA